MSPDPPGQIPAPPPPPCPEAGTGSPVLALLIAASGGTIALVWGFETGACKGIVAGAIAAAMRASFLALTHLPEAGLLLLVFGVHLGLAYGATRRGPFRTRAELLALLLPLVSFLLGLLAADTAFFESRCALHPWR